MRTKFAHKGISLAHKAADIMGAGDVTRSMMVGAGSAMGAALPYIVSALILRGAGYRRLAGLVCLAGSLDTTGLDVAMRAAR